MERTDAGVHIVLAETHRPRAGLPTQPTATEWPGRSDPGRRGGRELTTAEFHVDFDIDFHDGDNDDGKEEDEFTESISVESTAGRSRAGDAVADEPRSGALADVVALGLDDIFADPPEWQERALCAQTDPEAFFPEKGGSTREAKRICSGCEVRSQCLEYALEKDERFGIWGGMSERERRRLRRQAV
nr:WhiB family transcriptional regulator [Candidatus Protofrankia californiensis]